MVDGGEKNPVYEDESHFVKNMLLNNLLNYFLYKVTHFTPFHFQGLMVKTHFTVQQ